MRLTSGEKRALQTQSKKTGSGRDSGTPRGVRAFRFEVLEAFTDCHYPAGGSWLQSAAPCRDLASLDRPLLCDGRLLFCAPRRTGRSIATGYQHGG